MSNKEHALIFCFWLQQSVEIESSRFLYRGEYFDNSKTTDMDRLYSYFLNSNYYKQMSKTLSEMKADKLVTTAEDLLEFRKTQEYIYASNSTKRLMCTLEGAFNIYYKESGQPWKLALHTFNEHKALEQFNSL